MLDAKELDRNKFTPNIFTVSAGIKMKNLQRSVIPTLPKSTGNMILMARIEDWINPPKERVKEPSTGNLTDEQIFNAIREMVIEVSGVGMEEFISPTHKHKFVRARMVVMYITRLCTKYSTKKIGKLLFRDHSTVLHNCRTMYDAISVKEDSTYQIYCKTLIRLEQNYNIIPDNSKQWLIDMRDGKERRINKFTEHKIRKIKLLSQSVSYSAIARMFDCHVELITRICKK